MMMSTMIVIKCCEIQWVNKEILKTMKIVYVDNAATSQPLCQEQTSLWANASSAHSLGIAARRAIEEARLRVAQNLRVHPTHVFFTASGTEATNLVIKNTPWCAIITSTIEHDATRKSVSSVDKPVILLPVDSKGTLNVSITNLEQQLRLIHNAKQVLITIIHTNNEIGTIQDLSYIAKIKTHLKSILPACEIVLHLDCVQSIGHDAPLRMPPFVDMISLSAHKFHGPRGVGILICTTPEYLRHQPLLHGGGQEAGVRPGTENLPGIRAAAEMLQRINDDKYWLSSSVKLQNLCDTVIHYLAPFILSGAIILTGNSNKKSINMLTFCIRGAKYKNILRRLDDCGICASSGSACSSASIIPSHVMTAIDVPPEYLWGHIRLSFSTQNTTREAHYIGQSLVTIIRSMCSV